jgi:hypothetical protein
MRDSLGWTLDDYKSLVDMASRHQAPPEWFASVMYRESDMNPRAKNSLGFRGLIQFSVDNLKNMFMLSDTQTENFTNLTPSKQMRFVDRFYKAWRPQDGWANRAQLYQATYMPSTIKWKGSDPGTILAKKGEQAYDLNLSLDPDKKGFITVNDLDRVIQARMDRSGSLWPVALQGIAAAGGDTGDWTYNVERTGWYTQTPGVTVVQPSPVPAVAAAVAGVGLLGLAVFIATRY